MPKMDNVVGAISNEDAQIVDVMYKDLAQYINGQSLEAQKLLDKSALSVQEKKDAEASKDELISYANDELTKLQDIITQLNSEDLAEDDRKELITNAEGSLELGKEYADKILNDAREVTTGMIDVEKDVVSEVDASIIAAPVTGTTTESTTESTTDETEVISAPAEPKVKAEIDVPEQKEIELQVPGTEDNSKYNTGTIKPAQPDYIDNPNSAVDFDNILDTSLTGPEVVKTTENKIDQTLTVDQAFSGNSPVAEKLELLRQNGKQPFKALISRLDSYNRAMSLDHIVSDIRGANCNYDLYTVLITNLSKQYSEAKPLLDIISAYFTLHGDNAFKEESLMRFDQKWEYGDVPLKEYKQLVMAISILANPATRNKNRKRVNVDGCAFDISIRENIKRYFELI